MASVLGLSGCALSHTASQNADAIAPSTMATNASALNPSPHIRKILAPSGALRVGVYLGSPTSMVRVPGTQESVGVALELGRALGQQLGVPVEITEFARVAAVLDAIKAEKLDMTFTNATTSRANLLTSWAVLKLVKVFPDPVVCQMYPPASTVPSFL